MERNIKKIKNIFKINNNNKYILEYIHIFTKILNKSIQMDNFPSEMQIGKITPSYKSGKDNSRLNKKHHRPVSVLTAFSKVFEQYILNQMLDHVNKILSDKISAYRKGYYFTACSPQTHWMKHLDNNQIVGAVLMDLSKAFDCIPHDLLIAKLAAYGFDKNTLKFFLSYLKALGGRNGLFEIF